MYLIIKQENNISLYECNNDAQILPIKNKGEKEQVYDSHKFWKWFMDKVDYASENLSFVVLSDNDNFTIPSDINLSEINYLQNNEPCKRKVEQLAQSYKLLSFPELKNFTIKKKKQDIRKIDKKIIQNIEKTNLADVYNKKTQEYKNDKR